MGKGFRQGRIGEEIKKILSQMLLTELKDPRLSRFISVSDVEVTRDGSYATCYINLLSSTDDKEAVKAEQEDVISGLNSAKGIIKREIGNQLRLRHVPELIFKMDLSTEYGRHIDSVLDSLGIKHEDDE